MQELYDAYLNSDLLAHNKAKVAEELNKRLHGMDTSRRTQSPGWFRVFSTVNR